MPVSKTTVALVMAALAMYLSSVHGAALNGTYYQDTPLTYNQEHKFSDGSPPLGTGLGARMPREENKYWKTTGNPCRDRRTLLFLNGHRRCSQGLVEDEEACVADVDARTHAIKCPRH